VINVGKTHRTVGLGSLPSTVPQQRKRPNVAKASFVAVGASDSDWRHRAACRDEDPELFQPIGSTGPALLQIEDAKAVCFRCPVQAACLEWALAVPIEHGVLGAASEDERRSMRRRAARDRLKAATA
jgi:WhiB family redox-sensing transcriptional regulator